MSASVPTRQVIQLSGFPISRRVAHLMSQPRFAFAKSHAPPSASSRRSVARPALAYGFPSRWLGGEGFFQPSGSADMPGTQEAPTVRQALPTSSRTLRLQLDLAAQASRLVNAVEDLLDGNALVGIRDRRGTRLDAVEEVTDLGLERVLLLDHGPDVDEVILLLAVDLEGIDA